MTNKNDSQDVRSYVRKRYGEFAARFQPEAKSTCGCSPRPQQETCCQPSDGAQTATVDQITRLYEAAEVSELPNEVTGLSAGCGDPVTLAALHPGQTVLDLGSGGGIDCFLAAKKVGVSGMVIGVDMTPEMLDKARANKARLGVENVDFRLGEIEHLPVEDESVDVILSNCVINLSPDKPQVFREAYRVLKPGGKLAVSDIVTNGPLPPELRNNLMSWAECISGAMDIQDYVEAIQAAGFIDIKANPIDFSKENIEAAVSQLDENIKHLLREYGSVEKLVFSAKVTATKPM